MTHLEPTPHLPGENLLSDDDDVILLTDEILPAEDDDIIELSEIVDLSDTLTDTLTDTPADIRANTLEAMKIPDPIKDKTGFFDLSDILEETDLKTENLPDFSGTESETLKLDFDRISDPFPIEPKMSAEDAASLDILHGNDSEEIIELAADKDSDADDGLILLQNVAPLTLENDFVESMSLSDQPAHASTLPTSDVSKAPDTEYHMDDLQQLINEVVHDSRVPHQDLPEIHSDLDKSTEKDAASYKDMTAFQSSDQIDAAMERVIRNLFAERIGLILDDVVKTTVTKEIENLKKIFLDYLTSGRPADKIKA